MCARRRARLIHGRIGSLAHRMWCACRPARKTKVERFGHGGKECNNQNYLPARRPAHCFNITGDSHSLLKRPGWHARQLYFGQKDSRGDFFCRKQQLPRRWTGPMSWVHPQWVRLLDLMQMHVRYSRCACVELYTNGGERVVWNDALRLGRRALKTS